MHSNLESLKKRFKENESVIKSQGKRVQYLETRATHLVVSYFYIMVMVLLVVSQPSLGVHKYWWIPFYFSLLVALFLVPTISSTINRWARTQHYYHLSFVAQEQTYQQMLMLLNQRIDPEHEASRIGLGLGPTEMTSGAHENRLLGPAKSNTLDLEAYQQRAYNVFVVFTLLASTALVLYACRYISKTQSQQS